MTESPQETQQIVQEHFSIQDLIRAYQVWGHLHARLDPLDITNLPQPYHHMQDTQGSQFTEDEVDMDDLVFQLPPITWIGGDKTSLPLKEIKSRLEVQ